MAIPCSCCEQVRDGVLHACGVHFFCWTCKAFGHDRGHGCLLMLAKYLVQVKGQVHPAYFGSTRYIAFNVYRREEERSRAVALIQIDGQDRKTLRESDAWKAARP